MKGLCVGLYRTDGLINRHVFEKFSVNKNCYAQTANNVGSGNYLRSRPDLPTHDQPMTMGDSDTRKRVPRR